jgi:hypothetical protein
MRTCTTKIMKLETLKMRAKAESATETNGHYKIVEKKTYELRF